jgi:hypothetical protein
MVQRSCGRLIRDFQIFTANCGTHLKEGKINMIDPSKKILEESITEEINKSGYPLEISISIVLNRNGWSVRPSLDYFDEILKDYREADIVAYKDANCCNIFNILVVECKKSVEKPWVFIKQNRIGNLSENLNIACFRQDFIYYDKLEETMDYHHYSKTPLCTYYIVPFTAEDKKDNQKLAKSIFHAKNQVISALSHIYEQRTKMFKESREITRRDFLYPVIVFDGTLYSASINENETILIEENHVLLSLERELPQKRTIGLSENSSRYQEYKPFIIDIIKKEYFENFLKEFENYYVNSSEKLKGCFNEK